MVWFILISLLSHIWVVTMTPWVCRTFAKLFSYACLMFIFVALSPSSSQAIVVRCCVASMSVANQFEDRRQQRQGHSRRSATTLGQRSRNILFRVASRPQVALMGMPRATKVSAPLASLLTTESATGKRLSQGHIGLSIQGKNRQTQANRAGGHFGMGGLITRKQYEV